MLLYGEPGGTEYFSWWLIAVTQNSLTLAVAITLRVFAVALPMVVLARDIDPTELGDAFSQILKLPSRFVIGAVAGVRMMTLFQSDWQSLGMARRARGLTDVGKLQHVLTMSFGLLVIALRRGGKLATAMEARGFGTGKRSWARVPAYSRRDAYVAVAAAVIVACAYGVSLGLGTLRFLWQ